MQFKAIDDLLQWTGLKKPKIAEERSAHIPAATPLPALQNPRDILSVRAKTLAIDFVRRGNVLSPDERDKACLVDLICSEVENVQQPFLPEDRNRLDTLIERMTNRSLTLAADIEKANAQAVRREDSLQPPPSKERASEVTIAAAVALYAFGTTTSIQPAFDGIDDDPLIGWACALLFGLAAGAMITYTILQTQGKGND